MMVLATTWHLLMVTVLVALLSIAVICIQVIVNHYLHRPALWSFWKTFLIVLVLTYLAGFILRLLEIPQYYD